MHTHEFTGDSTCILKGPALQTLLKWPSYQKLAFRSPQHCFIHFCCTFDNALPLETMQQQDWSYCLEGGISVWLQSEQLHTRQSDPCWADSNARRANRYAWKGERLIEKARHMLLPKNCCTTKFLRLRVNASVLNDQLSRQRYFYFGEATDVLNPLDFA